jgi:hypothetical protein
MRRMYRVGMGGEELGCSRSLEWEDAKRHLEFIFMRRVGCDCDGRCAGDLRVSCLSSQAVLLVPVVCQTAHNHRDWLSRRAHSSTFHQKSTISRITVMCQCDPTRCMEETNS